MMFERAFQWTVHNGSRILFAIAIVLILFDTLNSVWNAMRLPYGGRAGATIIFRNFVVGLHNAVLPLVAAIAIEHFRARVGHTDV